MTRQRVAVVYYNPDIKEEGIEFTTIGVRLSQAGFRFDESQKVTFEGDTVFLNGTIERTITADDFMSKIEGILGLGGVNFKDYEYPYPAHPVHHSPGCDCYRFDFETGGKCIGRIKPLWLMSD